MHARTKERCNAHTCTQNTQLQLDYIQLLWRHHYPVDAQIGYDWKYRLVAFITIVKYDSKTFS